MSLNSPSFASSKPGSGSSRGTLSRDHLIRDSLAVDDLRDLRDTKGRASTL